MKIVIRSNLNIALTQWRDRSDIPNTAGYKLLVLHRLANIAIADVVGWTPAR